MEWFIVLDRHMRIPDDANPESRWIFENLWYIFQSLNSMDNVKLCLPFCSEQTSLKIREDRPAHASLMLF